MPFHGKKLMILGGNPETGVLVRAANEMGLVTIVADPNPDAPAKRDAGTRYDVDGFDIAGLVNVARRERVDGVLVGVADILVGPYQQVCDALGLPCYATPEMTAALTTKDGFRAACARYGIDSIPSYDLDETLRPEDLAAIEYPVMLKPVDNGGGVGMVVCHNESELVAGVRFSMRHSKRGKFLTERYMTCDDVFAYYTFQDGQIYLSAMADRITTRGQGKVSPVCVAARYPSKYLDLYLATTHQRMCEMFRGLGVGNGVLNVQFFVDGSTFRAYDPGFRLQGEAPHVIINAVNGFDHRRMLVNFALTGSMGVPDLARRNDPYLRAKRACTLWFLLKSGTIGRIEGLSSLCQDRSVVFTMQRLHEGDVISDDMVGTERQVLARVYVVSDSTEALRRKLSEIQSSVRVLDASGRDMIADQFNPDLAW